MEPTTILFALTALVLGALIGWLVATNKAAKEKLVLSSTKDARIAELERNVERLNSTVSAREEALQEAKVNILNTFKAAASDALATNNKQFLELAKQNLEGTVTDANGQLDQRKAAIEELLKPLTVSINEHKKRTQEMEKASLETFGNVHALLGSLKGSQEELGKQTGSLVSALKNPRVRGRWGEIGLRRVVEFSGMNQYCDFTEQTHVRTEDERSLRPDMIVKLPNSRNIIVDSKLPLAAYLDAVEAADDLTREDHLKRYAAAVRGHMNALSKKEYWAQFDTHADFVVLYIEVEPAFGTVMELDRMLNDDAWKNNVIFATPSILIALLRSIALSWQQKDLTKNAEEIADAAAELHERLGKYAEHLAGIGKGLNSAVKCYNSAIGSYETRILPSGRRIEDLHSKLKTNALKGVESVEAIVKVVRGAESEEGPTITKVDDALH